MKAQIKILIFIPLFAFLTSCSQTNGNCKSEASIKNTTNQNKSIDSSGKTIVLRFLTPDGYERFSYNKNTFEYFLSNFPLKPIDAKVYYFNGEEKPNRNVYASVFDIDVGKKDLQQCADAVMRLRAEYLFGQKKFKEIHFNFTNGFRVDYIKWAEGNRIKISGKKTSWFKTKDADYSYKAFQEYLEIIFSYAGTLSLSKELEKVPLDSIRVGDIFIIGGSPGHAVIVVDLALNKKTNKKIFMIAQSYMPAQNIHLLVNLENKEISPWYDLTQTDKLYSPEYTFEKSDLKRFSK